MCLDVFRLCHKRIREAQAAQESSFLLIGLIKFVWLPVTHHHGCQSATSMASSQPLPRSSQPQPLPWLPVSHNYGFQSAITKAAAVLFLLRFLASCSPKTQRCQQLHHLLPFDSNLFQVFCEIINLMSFAERTL
ncbi:TPA: hypothetical protein ACH3X1_014686 [Trebouxia sp. C0004]